MPARGSPGVRRRSVGALSRTGKVGALREHPAGAAGALRGHRVEATPAARRGAGRYAHISDCADRRRDRRLRAAGRAQKRPVHSYASGDTSRAASACCCAARCSPCRDGRRGAHPGAVEAARRIALRASSERQRASLELTCRHSRIHSVPAKFAGASINSGSGVARNILAHTPRHCARGTGGLR
jgi:hypothetical protein